MVKTLEEIEKEVEGNLVMRIAMKATIQKLNVAVQQTSPEVIKTIILGKRKLTPKEFEEVSKRFGVNGIQSIEMLERLTIPQKQFIFKKMNWDIAEVV